MLKMKKTVVTIALFALLAVAAVVSALNIESVTARGCERKGTCGLDSDPGEPLEAQKEEQMQQSESITK